MEPFVNPSKLAQNAIDYSKQIAEELGHEQIGTEHILLGLLREESGIASMLLKDIGIEYEDVKAIVINMLGRGEPKSSVEDFTPRVKKIFELSLEESQRIKSSRVGTEHILIGLIREGEGLAVMILKKMLGFELERLVDEILRMIGKEEYASEGDEFIEEESNLKKYGRDITELARKDKIDPVIGRETEIERVIQILSRRTKNNPCLIGEPGVGKTSVAEGLAHKIIQGEVPDTLKNKKLISLDLASMVAGAKYRGEFEERLKQVMEEVYNDNDTVLFIDEIHTVVGAGSSEGSIDAANIMKPALARGELQTIGATTLDEYRKYIEKDSALERRFQTVKVGEPNAEDAIKILKGLRDRYEAHHRVKITDEALKASVEISKRYITDRYLPDKAIDLIDEAASRVRLKALTPPQYIKQLESDLERLAEEKEDAISGQKFEKAAEVRDRERELKKELEEKRAEWVKNKQSNSKKVEYEDIAEVASSWTGIPVKKITVEESDRLLDLENKLHKRVIGQEDAIRSISSAVRRARVGLKDPQKPVGTFIFVGPTGVGKTYLAKSLAEALFGDEDAMIRVDMSEYMEKHSVSRLVGSPPGYVGHEEGGQLTKSVRERPYSVILFDEIEKAHPDIINILLQLLDDGRLTDSQGKVVDFKNTVIIMTSNVGARELNRQEIGFSMKDEDEKVKEEAKETRQNIDKELKKTFRPEFLNRIDDIIVFESLNEKQIFEVVELMIKDLASRVKSIDIDMDVSKEAKKYIAAQGYDRDFGARPLYRTIKNLIENKLSEEILRGDIDSGDDIVVEYKDSKIEFVKK